GRAALTRRLAALALLPASAVVAAHRPAATAPGPVAAQAPRAKAGPSKVEAGAAKLYDTSVLHQIAVEIAPDDAGRILARTSERVRATFTIDGRTLKNIGVRQSGGIYHPYVPIQGKPSLSVKFDEFVPQQKLFDLDKLILKNE